MFKRMQNWFRGEEVNKGSELLKEDYKHEQNKELLGIKYLLNLFIYSLTLFIALFGFVLSHLFEKMFESPEVLEEAVKHMETNKEAFFKIFDISLFQCSVVGIFFVGIGVSIIVIARKRQKSLADKIDAKEKKDAEDEG